jgi:hypothetical protein
MILFKSDWDKYPDAIVDTTTTNRSWVRQAVIYQKMGINNCYFHLSLLDPSLDGVDPFREDLDDITKIKIKHECANNPWYYYREVHRIPSKTGLEVNKLNANRGLLATLWLYHNHVDSTNTQLRQTGKSVRLEAPICWLLTSGVFNTTLLFGTINRSKQADTVRSIKEKLGLHPGYIYSAIKRKDWDNTVGVSNVSRKNYLLFCVGQGDKQAADKAGRGFSLANRFFDEVAETTNSQVSISASTSSSNAVIKEARERDRPYGTIYACTASTLDRDEGLFYYNLSKSGMPWSEKLLDSDDADDLRTTVGCNSFDPLAPLVDVVMSWKQLGMTRVEFDEIVAKVKRDSGGDMDKVKKECYSIWSRGDVANPLSTKQINTIVEGEREPLYVEKTKEKFIIRYYCKRGELPTIAYRTRIGIGLDSSNAVNNDSCSITICDLSNLEVLCRMDVNLTNINTYGLFVSDLLRDIPNSVLVIENKSSGQAIIDTCISILHKRGEDPFVRIFNRVFQYTEKYIKEYNDIRNTPLRRRNEFFYNKYRKYFGFMTSQKTRRELYNEVLSEGVNFGGGLIKDKVLIDQITALEERDGRVDHPVGGHDDAVISWLLVVWFTLRGVNYKNYNIPSSLPLSKALRIEDGLESENANKNKEEINQLLEIIPKLKDKIELYRGTLLCYKYKTKLEELLDYMESINYIPENAEGLRELLKS